MFREKYKHMNDQLHPSDELMADIIKTIQNKKKNTDTLFRKSIIIIVSICICMFMTIPVLADNVETIYQLMYNISPGIAQFFMPVQKTDEDNGIKIEVVSAYIHDNVAEFYITVKDLTGNRIDATTDLSDSYSINSTFNGSSICQRIGYDNNTKAATFLISMTEWENKKITRDKITFSVSEFISNKKSYEDIEIPIDLSSVSIADDTQKVFSSGGSGNNYEVNISNNGYTTALIPSKAMDEFPVDGIDLTSIGYIEGKIHIQTKVYDNLDKDNHGYFYLKDVEDNIINLEYDFGFFNHIEKPDRIDYYEYVFDIPQKDIEKYTLYGNFVTSSMHTQGNWQVTFPLESAK